LKYDSDEPYKQGSAADRVDFISHLRCKWTLASVRFPCLQDDCFSNSYKKVHFKGLPTPGQGLLCELDAVASYFDDDAVVSVIGLIFNGIAGPWYNISIFCYLLV